MTTGVRSPNENVVKLNVGGTRFWTSQETLLSSGAFYFEALLSGDYANVMDDEGAIFIDRDPAPFRVILNYMRTGRLNLDDAGSISPQTVHDEAIYYGVTAVAERIEPQLVNDSACNGLFFAGTLRPLEIEPAPAESPSSPRPLARAASPTQIPTILSAPSLPTPSTPSPSSLLARSSSTSATRQPVRFVISDHNWIAVAYDRVFYCLRYSDAQGWTAQVASSLLSNSIDHIALASRGGVRIVAVASGSEVRLWLCGDGQVQPRWHSGFDLGRRVDSLFFIGSCVVALSHSGRVGVWNSMSSKIWQVQDVAPISCHACTTSLLFVGFANGRIACIDMEKFPLRMKDDILLVNDFYFDPLGDAITSLSVFMTSSLSSSSSSSSDQCIELAYGTLGGLVRIVLLHPDTLGQHPQLFQTFSVHSSAVRVVQLTEHSLISVCEREHHVRAWRVPRFRGRISTQPGTVPIASYCLIPFGGPAATDLGPFGDRHQRQLFLMRVPHERAQVAVLEAATGKKICHVTTELGVTAVAVSELDSPLRLGARGKRMLVTGHDDGCVQLWDLTTALERYEARSAAVMPHRVIRRATNSESFEISDAVM